MSYKDYDQGYIDGYHSKENKGLDFQQGQVLMRNKCLQVIKKYYGSSVYEYLQQKINEIPLEE